VRAVPRLCGFYPGICIKTEEKHGKTSVRVVIIVMIICGFEQNGGPVYMLDSHSTVHKTQPHLPRPLELYRSTLPTVMKQRRRIFLLTDSSATVSVLAVYTVIF
jgi:hypothetical protein